MGFYGFYLSSKCDAFVKLLLESSNSRCNFRLDFVHLCPTSEVRFPQIASVFLSYFSILKIHPISPTGVFGEPVWISGAYNVRSSIAEIFCTRKTQLQQHIQHRCPAPYHRFPDAKELEASHWSSCWEDSACQIIVGHLTKAVESEEF